MATYRNHLPQLDAEVFLTDGGTETTLVFDDGLDLVDFAAFPLLDDTVGRAALVRYFDSYAEIAVRHGVGIVLETPTWRASSDWGARLGYDTDRLARVNRGAVDLLVDVRTRHAGPQTPVVISGCVGPRRDGYLPDELMTVDEARSYHALQIRTFAAGPVDLVTAITMTNVNEAIGIAQAAQASAVPVVISFTVETDGCLPTGTSLVEAIEAVDAATDSGPAYYMVNCAHPTHFADILNQDEPVLARVRGIRANASKASHAELDEATELDAGDPVELAADYVALRAVRDGITVLGGCCGTSAAHISAIGAACIR